MRAAAAARAGSQFLDPDGRFPNHVPNPEDASAMKSAAQAVKAHGAHLGVIFDTDVDRSGAPRDEPAARGPASATLL